MLDLDSTTKVELLSAHALAPLDTWESAVLDHAEDWARGIHAAHVHGETNGRFSILRALAGRKMLAEIALNCSRLQLWASQLGIRSAALTYVWDVYYSVEQSGLCVNERALQVMSTSQLQEVLANAELSTLHDFSAADIQPKRLDADRHTAAVTSLEL
eukprot:jgi/Ulvmu1/5887/UM026_0008.1